MVCIFLVFSALIEYAVVLLLLKKRRKPKAPKYTIDMGLRKMFKNGDAKTGEDGDARRPGAPNANRSLEVHADAMEDNGNKVSDLHLYATCI